MSAPNSPSLLSSDTSPQGVPIPDTATPTGIRVDGNACTTLRIFRREAPVTVLGPGRRAVIWVQGCPFACRNCIVPESWDAEGGEEVPVAELVDWALAQPDIEGLTLSGGEPMAQAGALIQLIRQIRAQRDLGVVCYTGYTHAHLCGHAASAQQELLQEIDLLIDGVYLEQRHADLLWRGSANQRLICLSERYRDVVTALTTEADRSAGVEFFMDAQGGVAFAGVPQQPGFREEFAGRMAQFGIAFDTENGGERDERSQVYVPDVDGGRDDGGRRSE